MTNNKYVCHHSSLNSLIRNGSDITNNGATINAARSTLTVIILANDDPHGVVGWMRTVALAQESEAINSTIQLLIERKGGTLGDIKVHYGTVKANHNDSVNEKPAVPWHDYVPVSDEIVIAHGINMTNISLQVIHVCTKIYKNILNYKLILIAIMVRLLLIK